MEYTISTEREYIEGTKRVLERFSDRWRDEVKNHDKWAITLRATESDGRFEYNDTVISGTCNFNNGLSDSAFEMKIIYDKGFHCFEREVREYLETLDLPKRMDVVFIEGTLDSDDFRKGVYSLVD